HAGATERVFPVPDRLRRAPHRARSSRALRAAAGEPERCICAGPHRPDVREAGADRQGDGVLPEGHGVDDAQSYDGWIAAARAAEARGGEMTILRRTFLTLRFRPAHGQIRRAWICRVSHFPCVSRWHTARNVLAGHELPFPNRYFVP